MAIKTSEYNKAPLCSAISWCKRDLAEGPICALDIPTERFFFCLDPTEHSWFSCQVFFYHVITGCEGYITLILSCLHYPVIQEMSVSWRWTPMATMWESSTHPDSKWVHFWLLRSIRLSLFRKWSKPSLNSCRWTVPHIGFCWFQN